MRARRPSQDVDIVRDPEAAKAHISYMPQRFGLYEDLTVDGEHPLLCRCVRRPSQRNENSAASANCSTPPAWSHLRLGWQASSPAGMKQKLGLVCALIHRPRVILLDEPTNGVDPVSRRDFWRILYSLLNEGIAILMSTSYLDEAERCHRVALLHQGQMLFARRLRD